MRRPGLQTWLWLLCVGELRLAASLMGDVTAELLCARCCCCCCCVLVCNRRVLLIAARVSSMKGDRLPPPSSLPKINGAPFHNLCLFFFSPSHAGAPGAQSNTLCSSDPTHVNFLTWRRKLRFSFCDYFRVLDRVVDLSPPRPLPNVTVIKTPFRRNKPLSVTVLHNQRETHTRKHTHTEVEWVDAARITRRVWGGVKSPWLRDSDSSLSICL